MRLPEENLSTRTLAPALARMSNLVESSHLGAVAMLSLLFGLRPQPNVIRNMRGMARVSIWSPLMRPYPLSPGALGLMTVTSKGAADGSGRASEILAALGVGVSSTLATWKTGRGGGLGSWLGPSW